MPETENKPAFFVIPAVVDEISEKQYITNVALPTEPRSMGFNPIQASATIKKMAFQTKTRALVRGTRMVAVIIPLQVPSELEKASVLGGSYYSRVPIQPVIDAIENITTIINDAILLAAHDITVACTARKEETIKYVREEDKRREDREEQMKKQTLEAQIKKAAIKDEDVKEDQETDTDFEEASDEDDDQSEASDEEMDVHLDHEKPE